jgi:hypothetical protein
VPATLPLSLRGADVQPWTPWVNPSLRRHEVKARIGDTYVVVDLFLATPTPSAAILEQAQRELDTLVLPSPGGSSPQPSPTNSERHVFAHGTDPLVGPWRLYTETENGRPVMGVLEPGQTTFTVELKPLGGRRFGTRLITGSPDGTNLLIQLLDPSATSAELEMDDGTVVAGQLVELPVEFGGPAHVLVAGFVSHVSEEGTKYNPDGVIVALGADGRELGRRRLSSG